jgi:hypothetical protein
MAAMPWPLCVPCRILGRASSSSKQYLNFSLISFKFSLMNVLCRVLRRATNEFNFKNGLFWFSFMLALHINQ